MAYLDITKCGSNESKTDASKIENVKIMGKTKVVVHALLLGGYVSFPDGVVKVHPNFRCVMTGNTWGKGATRAYNSAQTLDGSTLSRFVKMAWEIDEKLELAIVPNTDWVKRVQAIRAAVKAVGVDVIICPRCAINGAKIMRKGFSQERAEEMTIWAGMDNTTKSKILGAVK